MGDIKDGNISYSEIGKLVLNEIEMAIKLKKNILIPNYVIMPNHIHLIVELRNEKVSSKVSPNILPLGDGFERRGHIAPLQKSSLPAFVNRLKGRVTRRAREIGYMDFGWQARFNDRIIRNDKEYRAIDAYINENMLNWNKDAEWK